MTLCHFANKAISKNLSLPKTRALIGAHQHYLSTSSAQTNESAIPFYPVYVHHLSQVALEHLQNERSEWVVDQGLNRGLRLNQDGTFVLHFPAIKEGQDGGRIWTSYDGTKKQHWLSIYKETLVGRFLLKDSYDQSRNEQHVNDNVRGCVDRMIEQLTELEAKHHQAPKE